MRVLNVGGGPRTTKLPKHYDGYDQVWLDIDDKHAPDVKLDARDLTELEAGSYDGVYCSHNLEHYYPHDVPRVLRGFRHVLGDRGIAEIIVPDILAVVSVMVEHGMDIEDVLYQSLDGPITIRDVIYGWGLEIEQSGNDFYAHKTGFTAKSLEGAIRAAGFAHVEVRHGQYFEAHAFASMAAERLQVTEPWKRFYE